MDTSRLLRATVALVAVALFAGAVGTTLNWLLRLAGVAPNDAYVVGSAVAVAVALSIADTYTPVGSGPTEQLRAQPARKLVANFAAAGVVAAAVGSLLALLGVADVAGGLLAMAIAVVIGYGTFIALNVEQYRPDRGERPPPAR